MPCIFPKTRAVTWANYNWHVSLDHACQVTSFACHVLNLFKNHVGYTQTGATHRQVQHIGKHSDASQPLA